MQYFSDVIKCHTHPSVHMSYKTILHRNAQCDHLTFCTTFESLFLAVSRDKQCMHSIVGNSFKALNQTER